MNKIFKVVWSASKKCYVVVSELATNTSGKKKIMVATVLAALAMGGSLQVGAETVVTADKINTGVLTLDNATFKSEGNSETTIQSDAIRMSGGGTDWKTEILPGFVGIETDEYTAMLSAEGTYIGEINGGAGTLILPNGLTVNKSNDKELTYTLDKVSVGGNKIENVAEGTEDSDAVNLKQLKSYVNATDKDTHSTVTAGENVEVNTSTNSDNTTNYEVKLKKDLTNLKSASYVYNNGDESIKIDGSTGTIKTGLLDADNINAFSATFENGGKVAKINGAEISLDTGHDLDSWVTSLQPGVLGVKNGDAQFMVVEGAAAISDLEDKNTSGMTPKGFFIMGENDKELAYTLDKVSVGGNKIENVAEGTEDTDAVNLKQLKSYVNATDKDTHSTVTAGENIEVNTSTNSDNTTNYEVKLKKDLTSVNSISLEDSVGHETIKLNGNDGSIEADTIDANKVTANRVTATSATFKDGNIVTNITGSEFSMVIGDGGTNPRKSIIQPGLIAVETEEASTYLSYHGINTHDERGANETIIGPKGIMTGNEAGKVIEYNLDKISAGGMKVQDVAEGTADTDAVNLKQLKSYVDSKSNSTPVRIPTISQNGANTNVLIGANPDGSTNYTVSVNPDLLNMNSAEFGLETEDKRALVNKEKAQFFDGDVNTAISANGTKLENTNNLDTAEYTMDGMQANSNGKLVRFGTLGINAGDQVIAGVKAGVADTDVVNVKQLKDSIIQASDAAVAKSAWNLSANGGATETISGGDTVNFVSGNNVEVTRTGKDITVGTKDNVTFTKATVGNVVVDGAANTVIGLANTTWDANNVTANRAATEGQLKEAISNISNLAVDTAGVKLGYKADGANAQTTSLKDGLNFKSGELTTATVGENGEVTYNVKTSTLTIDGKGTVKGEAGVATSDNVAKVINQVVQQNSSDTKELKQAISNVSTESQRVGAHAAAMAALKPIQYDPMEPTQVMAGIGNYRGETAAALGLAHYTNENTMLNVGVSLGGTHNMVNAGVTHKFGSSPEKKNIPDRYKGGPISSIYVMQDELTQMQAKNDAQQVEIEHQRAEIESLKAMVSQLLAKN